MAVAPSGGHGGRRPGAGRPKRQPPAAPDDGVLPEFDIARHADPKTVAPEWDAELVDKFLRAYYAAHGSLRAACQKTGVPYRAAMAHKAENADFAERLAIADKAHLDVLLEEQQRRALDDPNRPASLIFELKSRHQDYKPSQGGGQVKVNIAFVDKAFGSTQAMAALPPASGVEPVVDAQIVPPDAR